MNHLSVFSTLYLIVASMSPLMGFHVLKLSAKSAVNRLFFAITICLAFWALGFSVVVVAPDEATCALWTKIAAVGYTTMYGALLNFALLLTGQARLPQKKWFYPLLYLPAAVCLYALVVSPGITGTIYHFERTAAGWTRTTVWGPYDTLFQVYCVGSVALSLALFWRWKRGSDRPEIKRQADILIAALLAAFALGSFTDLLNGTLLSLPLPKMAPVLFVLPLSAFLHCIHRYRFLKPPALRREERILNDNLRRMVFRIASIGLILGGAALFALEHFWWAAGSPFLTVIASALLVAMGSILLYAERTNKGYATLERLLILATLTVTPILTSNMTRLGGMTMWAFPLMLLVCSLMFNSNDMLFASGVSVLLSQLYLAGVAPQRTVLVDYRTYDGRIVILSFILSVAYYVHRTYLLRLRESASQSRIQALISGVVSSFSQANKENTESKMRALLEQLAGYFQTETVMILSLEEDFCELTGIRCACASGQDAPPERLEAAMRRWAEYRSENPANPDGSPCAQKDDPSQAERLGSSPWLIAPILMGQQAIAFLYVEAEGEGACWTDDQRIPLPFLSRIISGAMEKLMSEARIQFMAYYDALTRLPNRQLFHDRAEQAIHLARRNNAVLGILFLDLDFFKSINDTMGHEGGDRLIRAISQKLTDTLRKTDTVARFGGDEFLILLNNIGDVEHLSKVADKIMEVFHSPFLMNEQEIFITASAGISVFPADGEDADTLVKHADIAMYTAKEKGKNQYAFCSSNMKEMVLYRVNLSNSLYRALERRELEVYYQPQIDLRTERITGLEALLRWFQPECGMISPMEFIPLAEQTGLINSIGAWVLETACRQTALWEAAGLGSLRIAVNLSVVQLRHPGFVAQVDQILKKTGIDPAQVELEITESTTMREPDYIIRVLTALKALGLSISIDDFGTEYSSLNRLKMLPIDKLKMDIQFVRGIDKSPKDRAITVVIMNLAKNLDMRLVAEGVESSSQLTFLKSRMCDEVQGFYYYKPMPAPEIERILRGQTDH